MYSNMHAQPSIHSLSAELELILASPQLAPDFVAAIFQHWFLCINETIFQSTVISEGKSDVKEGRWNLGRKVKL